MPGNCEYRSKFIATYSIAKSNKAGNSIFPVYCGLFYALAKSIYFANIYKIYINISSKIS